MPDAVENSGLGQTLTSTNNGYSHGVQGTHGLTATRTGAGDASHHERNNISAGRTVSNDEFQRSLTNLNAIFANNRAQMSSIDHDNELRFISRMSAAKSVERNYSMDTAEAASIRQVQDSNKSNEILDKMSQLAAGGIQNKSFTGMQPENNVQNAVATFNGLNQQNAVNTAGQITATAMELALAAVQQRQYSKPAA